MNAPYPWLEEAWQELTARQAQQRLGHAYLLAGREGLGKLALALAFTRLALCENAVDASPCGSCRSCILLDSGNHPDFIRVTPEEDKKSIGIDQIRALIDFYTLKSHYGRQKVAVLHPAELMTTNAANALLKLLEEPPPGALFLLVTHRPGHLPATVLSRCQRIALAAPDWPATLAWLDAQRAQRADLADARTRSLSGAPLTLLGQLESADASIHDRVIEILTGLANRSLGVLEASRRLAGDEARSTIEAIELIVRAVALIGAGEQPRHIHLAPAHERHLQSIANKLNSPGLFTFLDRTVEARATLARSSGVRGAEVVENLLYSFARMEPLGTSP
jgi:DNA polymerase III subunit delta'